MTGRGFARALAESAGCRFGTWVKIPALETVELLADAGFDFVVLDLEHAPLTLESAYRATVVAQALGMHVLVRVPDRSGSHLQRLLDAGVDGILVPRVADVGTARAAIDQMRFAPLGERGLGTTSRAGRWGGTARDDYLRHGDAILRGVQLEEVAALDDIERIVAIDGLNGVFIGTGDLELSSGRPPSDPGIARRIDRVLAVAGDAGIPVGTAVGDAEQAIAAARRGFRFVMVGNDASMFRTASAAVMAGLRSYRDEPGPVPGEEETT